MSQKSSINPSRFGRMTFLLALTTSSCCTITKALRLSRSIGICRVSSGRGARSSSMLLSSSTTNKEQRREGSSSSKSTCKRFLNLSDNNHYYWSTGTATHLSLKARRYDDDDDGVEKPLRRKFSSSTSVSAGGEDVDSVLDSILDDVLNVDTTKTVVDVRADEDVVFDNILNDVMSDVEHGTSVTTYNNHHSIPEILVEVSVNIQKTKTKKTELFSLLPFYSRTRNAVTQNLKSHG